MRKNTGPGRLLNHPAKFPWLPVRFIRRSGLVRQPRPAVGLNTGEGQIRVHCVALAILALAAAPACAQGVAKKPAPVARSPLTAFAVPQMIAVDGSRISLQPFARGLLREVVTPDGRTIKTAFTLLNNRLGMVSGDGSGNVVGMFAIDGATITTLYSAGGSETLMLEAGKSVSLLAQKAEGETACTAWYPAGHVFSADERKAALANYKKRLGLKLTRAEQASAGCDAILDKVQKAQQAVAAAAPPRRQPAVPPMPAFAPRTNADGADWDNFYAGFVAPHEGGYAANDGNGFPANYGINQGANPDVDVASLQQDEARQILYERYWLASGADQLPQALAMVHGDTAINMGVRAANDLLAQAGDDPLAYLDLRAERYRAIAAAQPDKAGYLPIWLARVDDLRAMIGGEARGPRYEAVYNDYPPQRRRMDWPPDAWDEEWDE
jgi:hypothetical protein